MWFFVREQSLQFLAPKFKWQKNFCLNLPFIYKLLTHKKQHTITMDHQIKKDKQEIELLISEMNALLQRVASGKVPRKQLHQATTVTGKDALFMKRQLIGYAHLTELYVIVTDSKYCQGMSYAFK